MKNVVVVLMAILAQGVAMAATAEPPLAPREVPWLAVDGRFGYDTPEGKPRIAPQYTEALPFVDGFAVVARDGGFGVIDSRGKFVVAAHYAMAKLFSIGRPGAALLVTKREYSAPWRFWQWRWMPEFNLLGGGNNGPVVVTKVPRAEWTVRLLPLGKTLYSDNRADDSGPMGTHQYWKNDWVPSRSLPRDLQMTVYGGLIRVNHELWRLTPEAGIVPLSKRVQGITAAGLLLVKDGERYRLEDQADKRLDPRVLSRASRLRIETSDGPYDLSKAGEMVAYPRIPYAIYRDQHGDNYFYPDFLKPFPRQVSDYHGAHATIKAQLILNQSVVVWDIPQSSYFAVISTAASSTRRLFLLHQDGHWNTQVPLYRDPRRLLSQGRISFGGQPGGVLDRQLRFHPLPLSSAVPCRQHPNWYMGKSDKTGKYGVFDVATQGWQVPPVYDYLQDEVAPGVAVYSIVKKDASGVKRDQFGLLDLAANKRITPPLYNRLEKNGYVVRVVDGKRLGFYINRRTGVEYRDHAQP